MHELEGNGVSHVFELAWISVRRGGAESLVAARLPAQLLSFLLHNNDDVHPTTSSSSSSHQKMKSEGG